MATIHLIAKAFNAQPATKTDHHFKVEVTVDYLNGQQVVVDATVNGLISRGVEKVLIDRSPLDAPDLTQRLYGNSSVSHGLAAALSLERAAGLTPPANARLMRNLMLGADFLQSHLLHFYGHSLPDFVDSSTLPSSLPNWFRGKRIAGSTAASLSNNFVVALEVRRKCLEMGALFGGGMHQTADFLPGGFFTVPRAQKIEEFKMHLGEVIAFVKNVYLNDVNLVADAYQDYLAIGAGCRNLLAYGAFDLDDLGQSKLLRRGRINAGSPKVETVDATAITEKVTSPWYSNQISGLRSRVGPPPQALQRKDPSAWLKSPRYQTRAYEVGPLARMAINGDCSLEISVMGRHLARAKEAEKVAQAMRDWISQLGNSLSAYRRYDVPTMAAGAGLTEASRGALGHWVKICGGKTAAYQVVVPTCWNASARDEAGKPGPMEEALVGTPVEDLNEPLEVIRVIRSFDPCQTCTLDVSRPRDQARTFILTAEQPAG